MSLFNAAVTKWSTQHCTSYRKCSKTIH